MMQTAFRLFALVCLVFMAASCGSGDDGSTPNTNANLSGIELSAGELDQPFQAGLTDYTATVGYFGDSLTLTATCEDPAATLTINSVTTAQGTPSGPLPLAEGTNVITIVVTAEDGTTTRSYALTVSRETANTFAQQAYIKASNTEAYDYFGRSVALSGDTLAVGVAWEDSSATGVGGDDTDNSAPGSGAVYVFTRSAGVWSQQAYIKASNTGTDDLFGSSVALSGDTLAVAAVNEDSAATGVGGDETDNSAPYAGAVYVFTRSAGVWSQQAYIKGSNTEWKDVFGTSVALSGDTLAVGAHYEDSAATGVGGDETDNSATNSGAVYVFTRNSGVWSQQAYIKASNTEADDRFGYSVALSGDALAVGAYWEDSAATGVGGDDTDNSAINAGAVYVFTRSAGQWRQQAYLKASNTGWGDSFGETVALSGDTLAVGACSEDSAATGVGGDEANNAATDSGAVYVFTRSAGAWSQQAYLKTSNTGWGDNFGFSVALSGDTLAVGAEWEDSAATGVGGDEADNSAHQSGAVYLFTRSSGVWSQQAYIKASNTEAGDFFGISVALSGDTLAVGAWYESSSATGVGGDETDNSAPQSGAVYIFR